MGCLDLAGYGLDLACFGLDLHCFGLSLPGQRSKSRPVTKVEQTPDKVPSRPEEWVMVPGRGLRQHVKSISTHTESLIDVLS